MKTVTYDETCWKLVPVEPTPAMIATAWTVLAAEKKRLGIARLGPGPGAGDFYRAMLSASPSPPEPEGK